MSTMAEEPQPQPQSIQDRIKSLNQAQIRQAPTGGPPPTPSTNSRPPKPSPPATRPPVRPKPKTPTGSFAGSDGSGHVPLRERETLPPPVITRTGQKTPDANGSLNINGNNNNNENEKPPPLPSRRQLSPSLANRRPSDQMSRKASFESTSSASTARTTSGASTATNESNNGRVMRAPAWGEAELPALPPRREQQEKQPVKKPYRPSLAPKTPARPANSPPKPPPPASPPRRKEEESEPPAPKLPPRRPSSNVTNGVSNAVPNGVAEPAAVNSVIGEYVKPPQRKVPPPPPSGASLDKLKQSSFGGLNKGREVPPRPVNGAQDDQTQDAPSSGASFDKLKQSAFGGLNKARGVSPRPVNDAQDDQPQDAPPPIPLSSRPDLSKIQATKPKPAEVAAAALRSQSTVCMKCRDFSAPDNHAARFPRESVPNGDLAWLGQQLTSPFPSDTDKARAIFTWLHHNIAYDVDSFFNDSIKGSTPDSTFSRGLAVCEGYAALYKTLANHGGLEAVVISGHGKGFSHTQLAPGDPVPPFKTGHAWNAVRIDGGQWKLIDACWGAGAVQGKGLPYKKRFDPEEFTMSNDHFGRRHYPSDARYFFRDDGRPSISWEEYMRDDYRKPNGEEPLTVYTGARENHGIGERTFQPLAKKIPVNTLGPIRFQFGLVCEHWTLQRSNIPAPQVFFLQAHGVDGRQKRYLPLEYVPGTGPNGGGDMWYVDVPDARELGAPGQKLTLYSVTKFGDRTDTRGLSVREFQSGIGKKAMSYGGVAAWELV